METEEKEVKKKLKMNGTVIVILLLILLIILCVVLFRIFQVKNGMNNNDANMGLATQSDQLVFYYDYHRGLIKKEKKNETILTEDQAYSIQYADGNIYYSTPNGLGGISIKKIDTNGKNEEILTSVFSNFSKIYVQDSNIYYVTSNPDTISKINVSGEGEEVLLQRSIQDFKVVEETIYFSDSMGFLCSINTNGENYKTLVKEKVFQKFQILKDDLYYFDAEENKLMKISLKDMKDKEEVTDKLDCDIFNVTTDGIYYFNKADSKIKYVSLKGNKERDIVEVNNNTTKINLVGNVIYYIDMEEGKTVTKTIKTNGK